MARPTTLPVWATTAANVTEPSEPKKASGFIAAERPPANWINWLFNLIYLWIANFIEELDAIVLAAGAEASARASADTALAGDIDAVEGNLVVLGGYINAEATARATADGVLDTRIDDLEGDVTRLSGIMHTIGLASEAPVNWRAHVVRRRTVVQGVPYSEQQVFLLLPEIASTSDLGTLSLTDVDAELFPQTMVQYVPIVIFDSDAGPQPIMGTLQITTSGAWEIRRGDMSEFGSSRVYKGFARQVISYYRS